MAAFCYFGGSEDLVAFCHLGVSVDLAAFCHLGDSVDFIEMFAQFSARLIVEYANSQNRHVL